MLKVCNLILFIAIIISQKCENLIKKRALMDSFLMAGTTRLVLDYWQFINFHSLYFSYEK